MKKLYFLSFMLSATLAFAQGAESFDNLGLSGSNYVDGSFVGDDDITWNYYHASGEQDYSIDGAGIILRRHNTDPNQSRLTATISGGIGSFSVDLRKAFTGNVQRNLQLLINGEVIDNFSPAFGAGADATIIPWTVSNINVAGEFTIEIRVTGTETSNTNRQVVLDNLSWTAYSSMGVGESNIAGLKLYPNPVTNGAFQISTDANAVKNVEIFDVLGKKVLTTSTEGSVNVGNLTAGIYVAKITENGKTATKKLVIK